MQAAKRTLTFTRFEEFYLIANRVLYIDGMLYIACLHALKYLTSLLVETDHYRYHIT